MPQNKEWALTRVISNILRTSVHAQLLPGLPLLP